jgi:hypothetical protein
MDSHNCHKLHRSAQRHSLNRSSVMSRHEGHNDTSHAHHTISYSCSRSSFLHPPLHTYKHPDIALQIMSRATSTTSSSSTTTPSLTPSGRPVSYTTASTPPPKPTYTFHWICPRSSCHTCIPIPQPPQRLHSNYYHDFAVCCTSDFAAPTLYKPNSPNV